ncbi:MAG: hypothetical protein V4713_12230 [Pseudomonadota bacterium]
MGAIKDSIISAWKGGIYVDSTVLIEVGVTLLVLVVLVSYAFTLTSRYHRKLKIQLDADTFADTSEATGEDRPYIPQEITDPTRPASGTPT